MLERVADLCQRQRARLEPVAGQPTIRNARASGTITAMELGGAESAYLSDLGPKLLGFFRERDLLRRPLGNTMYVMPPYYVDDADLDRT